MSEERIPPMGKLVNTFLVVRLAIERDIVEGQADPSGGSHQQDQERGHHQGHAERAAEVDPRSPPGHEARTHQGGGQHKSLNGHSQDPPEF